MSATRRLGLVAMLTAAAGLVATDSEATGVFTQSDWTSHSEDPDTTPASHPLNQVGWKRFYTAPKGVDTNTVVTLRALEVPLIETTEADFARGSIEKNEFNEDTIVVRGGGDATYLVLKGGLDLGAGTDGDLVIDGQEPAGSYQSTAYPKWLVAPQSLTASPASGTLTGTHTYAVTALSVAGETDPATATLGPINGASLSWMNDPCALNFRVYRDGQLIGEPTTNTFEDDGKAVIPGPTPPATNTTGRPFVMDRTWNVTSLVVRHCAGVVASSPTGLPAASWTRALEEQARLGMMPAAATYYYTVRSVDFSSIESRASAAEAGVTTMRDNSGVTVSWAAVQGADHYRVYRRAASGSYASPSLVCETPGTSCFDDGAAPKNGTPETLGNATRGGRVVVRSSGAITVDTNSSLDATGLGYAGAATVWCEYDAEYDYWWCSQPGGYQGGTTYGNPASSAAALPPGGGGGATAWAASAGSGGHGGAGASGGGGAGGGTYGAATLDVVYLGSGGGEGRSTGASYYGAGGSGGGAIDLSASQLVINGVLKAAGLSGTGSGSGGSIRLRASGVSLGPQAKILAPGGSGGGGGRVAIYTADGSPTVPPGAINVGNGTTYTTGQLGAFAASGSYESDLHDAGGPVVELGSVSFTGSIPAGVFPTAPVRVQVKSSPNGTDWPTEYLGPDCQTTSYYETSGEPLCPDHLGDRYFKFRLVLISVDGVSSPTVDSLTLRVSTWPKAAEALLISSPYDTGDKTGKVSSIQWTAQAPQPPGNVLQFQLRTSPGDAGVPLSWTKWLGPTGSSDLDSWYTLGDGSEAVNLDHRTGSDDRWVQYRVRLAAIGASAPTLAQVSVGFRARFGVDLAIDGDGTGMLGALGSGLGGSAAHMDVAPEGTENYVIDVRQTGDDLDSYRLSWPVLVGYTITVDGSPSPVTVGSGAHTLAVATPADATGNRSFILDAVSNADTTKVDSVKVGLSFFALEPPGPVSVDTSRSPGPGGTAVRLNQDFCWLVPTGTGPFAYEMQLAAEPGFSQMIAETPADFADLCWNATLPAGGTAYYWRVRAKSPWFPEPAAWAVVPVWSFATGYPPVAVSAIYPGDGQADLGLFPTLMWQAGVGGAGSEPVCYAVGHGATDSDAQTQSNYSQQCGSSEQIGPLAALTAYRWCVRAENGFGAGPWRCFGFTTGTRDLPGAPAWAAPKDSDNEVSLTPVLSWHAGAGPIPDCYQVGVGATDAAAQASALTACSESLGWQSSLSAEAAYRACLRGVASGLLGPWSCIGFETGAVPSAPRLAYPADGSISATTVARFGWNALAGDVQARGYRARLWDPADPQARNREVETVGLSVDIPLAAGKSYLWSVRAFNDVGEGPASEPWTIIAAAQANELAAIPIVDPLRGTEELTQFTFDATDSSAKAQSTIASYVWEMGDGSPPLSAAKLGYVYPLAGGYQARLTVRDSEGSMDEARVAVTVLTREGRVPPTVRAELLSAPGAAPLTVRLSATAGDGSGHVAALVWALGDGSSAEGPSVVRTYESAGTYVARVTAVDDQGLTATDLVVISVASAADGRQAPLVRAFARPASVKVGEEVSPECVAADAAEPGATFTYAWDLGASGSAAGAMAPAQVFVEAGIHRLTCTATSATSGLSSTDSVEVHVQTASGQLPPRIVTSGATQACAGHPYLYNDAGRAAAQGSAPLLWTAMAPRGWAVDPGTGFVTWTPDADQMGTQHVLLQVENEAGVDSQELVVEVKDCATPASSSEEGCSCQGLGGSAEAAILVGLLGLWRLRRRRSPVRAQGVSPGASRRNDS